MLVEKSDNVRNWKEKQVHEYTSNKIFFIYEKYNQI